MTDHMDLICTLLNPVLKGNVLPNQFLFFFILLIEENDIIRIF